MHNRVQSTHRTTTKEMKLDTIKHITCELIGNNEFLKEYHGGTYSSTLGEILDRIIDKDCTITILIDGTIIAS